MRLVRDAAPDPANLAVTIGDVKTHLRIDHSDEDAALSAMIRTATDALDGREGMLGRALLRQRWRLLLDAFPPGGVITLPLPPLLSVVSLSYAPADGSSPLTLPPSEYLVDGIGDHGSAAIMPAIGKAWPATARLPAAVSLIFEAGYGDDAEDIPEPIRHAIRLHVGSLYESREAGLVTQFSGKAFANLPEYDRLLQPFRLYSFG
jgi:uncharacterized phiE125 gp8 family phage protein